MTMYSRHALACRVRLDLKDKALLPGLPGLKPQWCDGVGRPIERPHREQSTLGLSCRSPDNDLAGKRISAVEREITRRWNLIGDPYQLSIDTRVENRS